MQSWATWVLTSTNWMMWGVYLSSYLDKLQETPLAFPRWPRVVRLFFLCLPNPFLCVFWRRTFQILSHIHRLQWKMASMKMNFQKTVKRGCSNELWVGYDSRYGSASKSRDYTCKRPKLRNNYKRKVPLVHVQKLGIIENSLILV